MLSTSAISMARYIERNGVAATARAAWKMIQPIDFYFYAKPLDPTGTPPQLPSGARFCGDALDELRHHRSDGLPKEFYADEIRGVELPFVAFIGKNPASIMWLYTSKQNRKLFRLEPGFVELGGASTVRDYRSRGLFRSLLAFSVHWLATHGYPLVLTSTARDNPVPTAAVNELHFERLAVIRRPSAFGPKFITPELRAQTWREFFTRS